MLHFGLVPAVGATVVPAIAALLFVLLIFLVPSTLIIIVATRLGIGRKAGKSSVSRSKLAIKLAGFALYHLIMFIIWIATWPQFTNTVHTGYDLTGIVYMALVMSLWTGTGFFMIYIWNLLQNANTKIPGIGFYLRLFIWNTVIFITLRQIVYWVITL